MPKWFINLLFSIALALGLTWFWIGPALNAQGHGWWIVASSISGVSFGLCLWIGERLSVGAGRLQTPKHY